MNRRDCTIKSNKFLKAISFILCTVLISATFVHEDVFAYHKLPEEKRLNVSLNLGSAASAAAVFEAILEYCNVWGKDTARRERKFEYPEGGVWCHSVTRRVAISALTHRSRIHRVSAVIGEDVDKDVADAGQWATACVSNFLPSSIEDVHVYYVYP